MEIRTNRIGKQQIQAFWQRQFSLPITRGQRIFDALFGILAPILCIVFDPFVFFDHWYSPLAYVWIFSYVGIIIGVLALFFWLVFGEQFKRASGFFAGIFLIGSLFSLIVGVTILPFGLIGILYFLRDHEIVDLQGIFCFTPFVTSFVYWRNCSRATHYAKQIFKNHAKSYTGTFALGIIIAVGLPSILQWQANRYVSQSIEALVYGDPQSVQQAAKNLEKAFWCMEICYDSNFLKFMLESDQAFKEELIHGYYRDLDGIPVPIENPFLRTWYRAIGR